MPTLIRLLVILLVLAGLVYGGMFALTVLVTPSEKEVTVRIPARDLVPARDREPLVRREIDTSRTATPPARPVEPEAAPSPAAEIPPPNTDSAGDDDVVTLAPGVE